MDERDLIRRASELDKKMRAIPKERKRIGIATDLSMKLVAVLGDLFGFILNVIPIIGGFLASGVGIVGNIVFALWYLLLRVRPIEGKRSRRAFIVRILVFIFELVPYVNILPGFSIAVFYTNNMVRKEDKEYNEDIRKKREALAAEERQLQNDIVRYQQYQDEEYLIQQSEQNQIDDDEAYREVA